MHLSREQLLSKVEQAFKVTKIVCLLGPRQCGKTTIARDLLKKYNLDNKYAGYFDLERPADYLALQNPDLILPKLTGIIIIDEVQRHGELFPYLRYLHDEEIDQQILLLGSASRDIINKSSESLAGRITFIEITPFSLNEVDNIDNLWLKGGFPRSYLLDNEHSILWRDGYMRTYVEHDLSAFGFNFQVDILQKMWYMLAHYHGQIINYSELAASLGVSQPTINKYVSFLASSFMLRILKPWHENIGKRQVKSPKVYYRDSGLLHYVLGIHHYLDIFRNPRAGASFEGFAIEELIKSSGVSADSCYFWRSHNQAELDLLILKNGKKYGFEFKMSDTPTITKSMKIALDDLSLERLCVIYPGDRAFALADNIQVLPLNQIWGFEW